MISQPESNMATSGSIPSPEASPTSPSTAMTTPEQPPLQDNDDVWTSDNEQNEDSHRNGTHIPQRQDLLSDIPTIRRQHMTDGYREGLTVGKAKVMQQGFDQGYPIGISIALRTGKILGVLEGCLAAAAASQSKLSHPSENTSDLRKMYREALVELACPALMKEVNDEVIAKASEVPSSIEMIIRKWEMLVLGSTREEKSRRDRLLLIPSHISTTQELVVQGRTRTYVSNLAGDHYKRRGM